MKTVAKILFNAEVSRNLEDNLWDVVVENNWNTFGSINIDCLAKAEEVAKEIAIKNEVTASVTIYGTSDNGRFDKNNIIKSYALS
jgi:hypothetical protein